jgi:hypothetical protein
MSSVATTELRPRDGNSVATELRPRWWLDRDSTYWAAVALFNTMALLQFCSSGAYKTAVDL